MAKRLLSKHEELIEQRITWWLSIPIMHRAYLHTNTGSIITGISGILFGGIAICGELNRMDLIPLFGLPLLAVFLIELGMLFIPCRCGKQPIFTRKAKKYWGSAGAVKTTVISLLALLGTWAFIATTQSFLGVHITVMLFAGLFVLVGAYQLITGLTGQANARMSKIILTDQERERINSLSRQTLADLDQLLEHQLKFGKFDEAEETSKLMLSMADAEVVDLDEAVPKIND